MHSLRALNIQMVIKLLRKNKLDILSLGYDFYNNSPMGYKLDYVSKKDFVNGLSNFDVFGIYDDDSICGMVVFDNQNLHISVDKNTRGKWTHLMKHIIKYGIEKYGFVLATIDKKNTYVQKLVKRLQFKYIHSDGQYNIYCRK